MSPMMKLLSLVQCVVVADDEVVVIDAVTFVFTANCPSVPYVLICSDRCNGR